MLSSMNLRLLAPAALLVASLALAKDQFLPMEQAFSHALQAKGDCLTVYWNVAPGYYLYKDRMSVESLSPGIQIRAAQFPKGELHHDEYFGDQEILRDDFTVVVPLERQNAKQGQLAVKLKWQGCADAGLCYPPATLEVKVQLPAAGT